MKTFMLALVLVAGCTKATPNDTPSPPTQDKDKAGYAPPPTPAPAPKPAATIELSAVTFGDDCGGTVTTAPKPLPAAAHTAPATRVAPSVVAEHAPGEMAAPRDRRCDQTSMQLLIVAAADTDVKVKSVTVLDETGKELGTLATSKPTRWSTTSSAYEAWDEKVPAGQSAQVSYVLEQPGFVERYNRDHTYTVKVLASVGGVDQPLQTSVLVVALPPPVPT